MLDVKKIRLDFPFFDKKKNLPIYFDNACMSLRPRCVIDSINEYYEQYSACAGRSSHKRASFVTKKLEESRLLISRFINTRSEKEIIFTRNTTEAINLLANSLRLKKDDVVLLTDKEHNSNLVPWLLLRDKIGIKIEIINSKEDGSFDLDKYSELVKKASLVSVVYTSNLDGVTNPARKIIEIAHNHKSLVFLDCAQAMIHQRIDVQLLGVDFLAFSGHKMLGPSATGVFFGKKELLEKLDSFVVGGETVSNVTYDNYELLPVPEKFEAGLQNYSGILGLGQAVKYLEKLDYDDIQKHEKKLNTEMTNQLISLSPNINIIGPKDPGLRSGVVNFFIEGKDMHQIAIMLDEMADIAVRSGRHCVHSWFNKKNILNSLRVSFSFYNTEEEVKIFITNLNKILEII